MRVRIGVGAVIRMVAVVIGVTVHSVSTVAGQTTRLYMILQRPHCGTAELVPGPSIAYRAGWERNCFVDRYTTT